ncbi:MAG: tetrachloroethene dehalogenase [Photobacterium frigidiphilum]|uniref:tetrachloroethene dehalogenase n=1 Tax=Photobacterium frigidiphilum TaxID=264736 RepID=UPI003001BC2A
MIGLMWYLMGMVTTAALWGYAYLRRNYLLDLKANLGLFSTFGLGWICVGWSWASFAEGEPQSGAMGMICFGLPAMIMAVVTWRKFIQPAIK